LAVFDFVIYLVILANFGLKSKQTPFKDVRITSSFMAKTLTIRWHSRAGQGAITASTALAEILGNHGKSVQSFPDFGAEKRGAPVTVFNRICDEVIEDVSHPKEVDAVVLLDTTLVSSCEISSEELLSGLKKYGVLLINTPQKSLKLSTESKKVFAVKASEIAQKEIGKDIPNVPILGALVKILGLAKAENFSQELEKYLSTHLAPEIVKGNLKAFGRGFTEVEVIAGGKNGLKKSSCEKLPSWKETPLAATVTVKNAGNSKEYNTGNWVRTSCQWNPETCINCNLCWPVCPHDAIKVDTEGNMIGVDDEKCTACGLCVVACPTNPKSLKIIPKKSSEI
jgi:pyruvate ferredoxin oxidoreductase gamma subunit